MSKGLYFLSFAVYIPILYYIFRFLKVREEQIDAAAENSSKCAAALGIMAALAALFQLAPVFLPGAGLILSPFSSLPVAVGALLYRRGALPMFLSAAGIISIIYIQEGAVFLFATGPLGLASAMAVMSDKPKWKKVFIPGLILTSGILILTFIIGLPGLVEAVGRFNIYISLLVIFLFSIVYSSVWVYIVFKLKKRLIPIIKDSLKP